MQAMRVKTHKTVTSNLEGKQSSAFFRWKLISTDNSLPRLSLIVLFFLLTKFYLRYALLSFAPACRGCPPVCSRVCAEIGADLTGVRSSTGTDLCRHEWLPGVSAFALHPSAAMDGVREKSASPNAVIMFYGTKRCLWNSSKDGPCENEWVIVLHRTSLLTRRRERESEATLRGSVQAKQTVEWRCEGKRGEGVRREDWGERGDKETHGLA